MQGLFARGEADAIKIRAEAEEKMLAVRAEGERAINEAANILSAEQLGLKQRLALIAAMPQIIAASVKPMENIDSIKIVDVSGLSDGYTGETSENGHGGSLADGVVQAALRYRSQAPLVDHLLAELGLSGISPVQLDQVPDQTESLRDSI
jgi:uncharacterized membrane protein YqiK